MPRKRKSLKRRTRQSRDTSRAALAPSRWGAMVAKVRGFSATFRSWTVEKRVLFVAGVVTIICGPFVVLGSISYSDSEVAVTAGDNSVVGTNGDVTYENSAIVNGPATVIFDHERSFDQEEIEQIADAVAKRLPRDNDAWEEDIRNGVNRLNERASAGDEEAKAALEHALESSDLLSMQIALTELALSRKNTADYAELSRAVAAVAYARGDYDEAEHWSKIVLEDYPEDCRATMHLGSVYRQRGELDAAEKTYRRVLDLCGGDARWRAMVLVNLSTISSARGDFEQAENEANRALALWSELRDEEGLAYTHTNLGIVDLERGDYNAAEKHFELAYTKFHKRVGTAEKMALVLNDLGVIYLNRGELKQAQAQFQNVLSILDEFHIESSRLVTYSNLAAVYLASGELTTAERFARMAQEIGERAKANEHLCTVYGIIGQIFEKQSRFDDAVKMHQRSLRTALTYRMRRQIASAQDHLGVIELRRGNVDSAKEYFEKAMEGASKFPADLAAIKSHLAMAHERLGDDVRAKELSEQSIQIALSCGHICEAAGGVVTPVA